MTRRLTLLLAATMLTAGAALAAPSGPPYDRAGSIWGTCDMSLTLIGSPTPECDATVSVSKATGRFEIDHWMTADAGGLVPTFGSSFVGARLYQLVPTPDGESSVTYRVDFQIDEAGVTRSGIADGNLSFNGELWAGASLVMMGCHNCPSAHSSITIADQDGVGIGPGSFSVVVTLASPDGSPLPAKPLTIQFGATAEIFSTLPAVGTTTERVEGTVVGYERISAAV